MTTVNLNLTGLSEADAANVLMFLVRERIDTETVAMAQHEPTPAPMGYTDEQERYITDTLPQGFDTVLGYTAKHMPEALVYDADVPECTQRDGFWLKHRCRERGHDVVKVRAPAVLQEQGIETVNAYPVRLLAERLG